MRTMALVCLILMASTAPDAHADQAAAYDELRRDIDLLIERLDRLEADNAELKARNEILETTIAQQAAAAPAPAPIVPAADAKPASKPWYESTKVGGYVIADAYAVLGNHDPAVDGRTGFWMRRAYLGFDTKISNDWSTRLRFEMNSPGNFTTNVRMSAFVKDAYLRWKRGDQELYLGISPTPTYAFVESFWGYRSIEKTPLDLYRMGSSRDFGISYKSEVLDGKVFYDAMFGNGAGEGAETNEGKKLMLSTGFRPTDRLVAQVYADFEDRPGNTDRTTYHGFIGWKGDRARYGLEYGFQDREAQSGPGEEVSVASIFGVWNLGDRSSLVARWDHAFDGFSDSDSIPYIPIATNTEFDLVIVGWDYRLHEQISLIPNVEYVTYGDTDGVPAPDDDLLARLTLYYRF